MPVKKFLAVMMAVMCVMSLTVTAFAAETDLPPGAQLLESGITKNSNDFTMEAPYVIPSNDVESITIKGLFYFSHIYGWDGTQWVKITGKIGDVKDSVTFSPSDYPEYSYFTVNKGDTMASQDFTVTWVKASVFGKVFDAIAVFTGTVFTAVGGPILAFITSNWLCLIPALFGIVILGIYVVKRFVYGS